MLVLDGASGQFAGSFTVSREGEDLVFVYDESGIFLRRDLEGSTVFLDMANLVEPGAPLDFECDFVLPGEVAIPAFDRDYREPTFEEVLALAERLGPLFGWGDADPSGNVVRESVAAWIAAAKVLNFAVRAHAYTGSPERMDAASMDGDVIYTLSSGEPSVYHPEGAVVVNGTKGLGASLPEPYARMLRLSDDDRKELMHPVAYGEAAVYGGWHCDDFFAVAAIIDAPYHAGDPVGNWIARGGDLRASGDTANEESLSNQQMIAETIFQQLVSVHLNSVRLGWGVMRDAKTDRELGTLCPQFRCLLQRIWYVLGLHHSGGKLGVCKRCGKLFSADNERKSTKIYCSKACQEAAKDERSKARRKRQRAEARKARK